MIRPAHPNLYSYGLLPQLPLINVNFSEISVAPSASKSGNVKANMTIDTEPNRRNFVTVYSSGSDTLDSTIVADPHTAQIRTGKVVPSNEDRFGSPRYPTIFLQVHLVYCCIQTAPRHSPDSPGRV